MSSGDGKEFDILARVLQIGITTGNPGVFQSNPYPYPSKPAGVRVIQKPQGYSTRSQVYINCYLDEH
jgi:hypothetical protein